MEAEKAHFPVAFMCRHLQVTRAGFYAWRARPPSARATEEQRLMVPLRTAFERARGTYGSPRVYRELRRAGHSVGRHRVARLMRKDGLRARRRRRFRIMTEGQASRRAAGNVLARDFSPPTADRAWAADITYVPTRQGWLYLAVVLDLFSRRVVGWSMSDRIDEQLAMEALEMALTMRQPAPGLLHHSDRGVQYSADGYQQLLRRWRVRCSMSRKGNCWDNAVVESFFSTLKNELVHGSDFDSRAQAKSALFEYIEVFYNRQRRHSTLDYVSPTEYERLAA